VVYRSEWFISVADERIDAIRAIGRPGHRGKAFDSIRRRKGHKERRMMFSLLQNQITPEAGSENIKIEKYKIEN
jgi:hypothetical protein